jgi:hypothetical protein
MSFGTRSGGADRDRESSQSINESPFLNGSFIDASDLWRVGQLLGIFDARPHSDTFRSRKAFMMTETELRLIAAPAMIGLSSTPKKG